MNEQPLDILIVDDDNLSRRLLKRTLQKWGYRVTEASDGEKAWEIYRQGKFAMVITDWMMPGTDGLELVRRIRQHPSGEYVYIIMLTARSLKKDVVVGMEAGADDFLVKPFNQEELRVRLRAGERILQLEKSLSERNRELALANQRMRQDLESAAKIQESLLPSSPPPMKSFRVAWRFHPCEELAGDILNVFSLDENTLGLYLLDVSGHGVAAALLAVTLSRLLSPMMDHSSVIKKRTLNPPGYRITPPAEVANLLNHRFQIDEKTGQYFTMVYGLFDAQKRTFHFVSAGHPPVVHLHEGKAELLEVPGLPIGFLPDVHYQDRVVSFQAGDRFFLYSDGIIEARNPEGICLGKERFVRYLLECQDISLEKCVDNVVDMVQEWTQSRQMEDDITLLAVEIRD